MSGPGTETKPRTHLVGTKAPPQPLAYEVLQLLGEGATSVVYLARDRLLDRQVALKFLGPSFQDRESFERLWAEARATARLQHPNVATLYGVDELEGRPFLITEYVRGTCLDRLVPPLEADEALRIGIGLARGLAAAHQVGILHRDVKPSNALLAEDGTVKLVDFGLAKVGVTSDGGCVRGLADPFAQTLVPGEQAPPAEASADDALVGTPLYMAPELWLGSGASTRSDVYSLGALLFELCSGLPPAGRIESLRELWERVTQASLPTLLSVAPQVSVGLARVVDRCLHRDPERRFGSALEVLDALEALSTPRQFRAFPVGNPYRGLRAFELEHRGLFLGRDRETEAVLERLRSEPLVVVTGDSGVGKSSLCRAGVLPRVLEGALDDTRRWTIRTFVPGRHPLAALAAELGAYLGVPTRTLSESLLGKPLELVQRLEAQHQRGTGLLLFVDQLEELVTLRVAEEANRLGDTLRGMVEQCRSVRVLATVRGDHLTALAGIPGFGDVLWRSVFLLGPLSLEGAREAVVGPTAATGVRFESEEMVQELASAASSSAAALPLVQFALAELWTHREVEQGLITRKCLAELGGVAGALAKHADRVLAALTTEERRAARRLLLQLVSTEGARIRRTREELTCDSEASQQALEAMVRGRLLAVHEAGTETTLELAHEALADSWSTLRGWLDEEADSRAVHRRLASAAAEWERLGRAGAALWSSAQLAEASSVTIPSLPATEAAFLRASRRGQVLRRRVGVSAATAVALSIAAVWLQGRQAVRAQAEQQLALARQTTEHSRELGAREEEARRRAMLAFDSMDLTTGEKRWEEALQLGQVIDRTLSSATGQIEAALLLHPDWTEAHQRLAELFYTRAERAERAHAFEQRDELLSRMSLHDSGGSFRARFQAPARLVIRSQPAGAEVTVERYQADAQGRYVPVQVGDELLTPTQKELPAGSYRLAFRAPGRARILLPVMLERGDTLEAVVDLPPSDQVPPGFVAIPRGRFVFGNSGSEPERLWLRTVPTHQVETEAFHIARTETTLGEYLTFLDTLSERERTLRLPRGGIPGMSASLRLSHGPGGWTFDFQPGTQPHRVREGEPLVYSGRERLRFVDWKRLPVMGISALDAEAYAAWLASTGRVPGARLCTEKEWERAARGADGRAFPHGERLDPVHANIDESHGRRAETFGPDEVGQHPESASPFGVEDLAGNVWEWTRSSLGPGHAVRGGSYYHGWRSALSANREPAEPTLRDLVQGMRLCATPLGAPRAQLARRADP